MSLTAVQIAALNDWDLSEPALKKGVLINVDEIKMGDLLNQTTATQIVKDEVLASSATTVVADISGVLLGDLVTAVITAPDTGGTTATTLEAVVTDDGEVTVTPDATPTNGDGTFDLIIIRPAA